jgi:hypothetical protein
MNKLILIAITLISCTASGAELQGRLFFTPAQRVQLEAARAQKDRQAPTVADESIAAPATEIVTYSGIVRRNDGKSTIWLNHTPINNRKTATHMGITGVRTDGAITFKPPQSERSISLKVGQSLEVESGVIEEPYARRFTQKPSVIQPAVVPARDPQKIAAQKSRARDDKNEDADSPTHGPGDLRK